MVTFLEEVSGRVAKLNKRSVVIAPNRRALHFIRQHLGEQAKLTWFYTIEDFVKQFSLLKLATKVELIPLLHESYVSAIGKDPEVSEIEALVDFYFWGDMLLKDFDLIDHYAANPAIVFRDLSQVKELDSVFDALTEEQIIHLEKFWDNIESKSESKNRFLVLWRKLYPIYSDFQQKLLDRDIAYSGMLYRGVVEKLTQGLLQEKIDRFNDRQLYFVGFNALTKTEEHIISWFVSEKGAEVMWDIDSFYLNNNMQEAGVFFREYKSHPVLGKTFPNSVPARLNNKKIHVIASATNIGQVKSMASMLARNSVNPQDNLVVLADEKLLTPVLSSVAPYSEHINVTMGYSLAQTPLASLVELFFELNLSWGSEGLYSRPLRSILNHPYVQAHLGEYANSLYATIMDNNWVYVPKEFIDAQQDFKNLLLCDNTLELPLAAASMLQTLSISEKLEGLDKDFLLYFLDFLHKLNPIFDRLHSHTGPISSSMSRSFVKLFRQLLAGEKIPFEGDPMVGMQVMGVLETRNLDFKNVYILSVNEGVFPQGATAGSYLPFAIRKAYGLPVAQHRDAMYAYLFYRLLQRSENVYLFYNASKNALGQGEMSRFIQQLEVEAPVEIVNHVQLSDSARVNRNSISVSKGSDILKALQTLAQKGLSPSAINMYLECELKFFFRYLLQYRELDYVEEDLDARVLGDILHRCMELMYSGHKTIEKSFISDLAENLDTFIDRVFKERFNVAPEKVVSYSGQRLVVKEIVKSFLDKILAIDMQYAPFDIEGLEYKDIKYELPLSTGEKVVLTGIIDRVDSKGGQMRIVDYKTGKDELYFSDVESLFDRDGKRNKAAFQTLLYAILYAKSKGTKGKNLTAGLYNRKNLFDSSFEFGLNNKGVVLTDVTLLEEEFMNRLNLLLEDMFNPSTNFKQTENKDACRMCEFANLCGKEKA